MNKIYLSVLSLCFWLFSSAQNTGSIYGNTTDTILKQAIPDVTLTILSAKDSSLITFGRTNKHGFFNIKYLPKGSYRLLATHVGYHNYTRYFQIDDDSKEINVGYLILNSKASLLEEVTVSQEIAPVSFRNDTIEFNAGSFKVKPNAVVEDLLKKLPGVQIDKDGRIKANGEEVKKILVDGKEFFGNDPKVASKNLPADAIDKVQVFDKKSDQSQFTGFDDGNSEKTINLTLKPDKRNGVFGRASAGAGSKDRYQGNFNINSFRGEQQVSVLGMANNTNKLGFSFMDLLNFTGGLDGPGSRGGGLAEVNNSGVPLQSAAANPNQAITTTWAGGLNFNDHLNKSIVVTGSYFFNRIEDAIDQKTNRQYLIGNKSFSRAQEAVTYKKNENHRLNIIADYAIDSMNSVKLSSNANIQASISNGNSVYQSISDKRFTLNSGSSLTQSNGDGYNLRNSLLWRHKFKKKGRTFSASLLLGVNVANNDARLNSKNSFYNADGSANSSDTLDQLSEQENNGVNYGLSLSYTEPLSKRSLLEASYGFNTSDNRSLKSTFDIDRSTGKYNLPNVSLSNHFDNQYVYHRTGISWRYHQKRMNFSIGSSFQKASLESRFHFLSNDSIVTQSFANLLPNARMQYNINKYKNFRASYNTYTVQPTALQLNPIIDNTDPLNIRVGNANLSQEFNHRVQFNYMAFDPFRRTSFFSMINFTVRENSIVNEDKINAQGVRVTKPVNANGVYNLNTVLSWGLPVKPIKSNLNLNTGFTQGRTVHFINGQKNSISNLRVNQEIILNFIHKEALDITGGAKLSFNHVHFSLTPGRDAIYWNQEYNLDANVYFFKGFSMACEFTFSQNTGYANGFNTNVALWNLGLAKQLFKSRKGELKLQVFDILNENAGISRNTDQNYIEDVYSKVLNRYLLVSFTYNISRFAGKNAPLQKGGNIKVIGERNRM